jgi:hypothetical protein
VQLFGGVSSSRDFKERFLEEHYRPYRERLKKARNAEVAVTERN